MSEIPSAWKDIVCRQEYNSYTFSAGPSPRADGESVIRLRALCAENKCGCYGTNWGCPPGSCTDEEAPEILGRYSDALIFYRRFEKSELADIGDFISISKEFQNVCRSLSAYGRGKGIDCLPLGDGGCTYCGKCTYPGEPCRHPDMRVMSISGMGFELGDYLKTQGIDFKFEDGAVTLYGLVLFNF